MVEILLIVFIVILLVEIIKTIRTKSVNSPLIKIIPEKLYYYFYLITLIIIDLVLLGVLIKIILEK